MKKIKSKHDWSKISTDLQFRQIPTEDMPRLLLDCISDLMLARNEAGGIILAIESVITLLEEQIKK